MAHRFLAYILIPSTNDLAWRDDVRLAAEQLELDVSEANSSFGQDGAAVVAIGGNRIVVLSNQHRLPEAECNQAVSASMDSAAARNAVVRHRAHVVVSSLAEVRSPELAKSQAVAMTAVIAGISKALGAIGCIWVTAGHLCLSNGIAGSLTAIARSGAATDLWLGLEPSAPPKGECSSGPEVSLPSLGARRSLK